MTVIATDRKIMVADKQTSTSDGIKISATKIFKVGDWIVGIAGTAIDGFIFLDWFKEHINGSDEDYPFSADSDADFYCLCLNTTTDELRLYTELRERFMPIENPFFAVGCGSSVAMTAMKLGKSPVEAVELACEMVEGCGMGIDII